MQKLKLIVTGGLFGLALWGVPQATQAATVAGDSLGVVVENGKTYILHQVDPGETLYALSRRYGAAVGEIQKVNNLGSTGLSVGQKLRIPAPHLNKPTSNNTTSGKPVNHKVAPGETLYAVSRKYNVSVADIKKWNNLQSDGLSVGQVLKVSAPGSDEVVVSEPKSKPNPEPVVVESKPADEVNNEVKPEPEVKNPPQVTGVHTVQAGETLYGIARKYGMTINEIRKLNKLESGAVAVGQTLKVAGGTETAGNANAGQEGGSDAQPGETRVEESTTQNNAGKSSWRIPPGATKELYQDNSTGQSYYRVSERGTAAKLESGDNGKFYALHKFLPEGSVVFVECPATNQTVLLKIKGRLDGGDDYSIRLSGRAMEYLLLDGPGEVVLKYAMPAD